MYHVCRSVLDVYSVVPMSVKVCSNIHVLNMYLKWGKLFACAGPGDRAAGPMRNGCVHMEDLLLLSQNTRANEASLPSQFCGIVTPLKEEVGQKLFAVIQTRCLQDTYWRRVSGMAST